MKKYGIEIIGYGKRRRYAIHQLLPDGTNPTTGRCYPTEAAARSAAEARGYHITAVGDFYQLMAAARREENNMKLYQDNNWKAIHFEDRTILASDYYLFSKLDWEELIYDVEIEPIGNGHYRAV